MPPEDIPADDIPAEDAARGRQVGAQKFLLHPPEIRARQGVERVMW